MNDYDYEYDQAVKAILAAVKEAKALGLDEAHMREHVRLSWNANSAIAVDAWVQAERDVYRELHKLAKWNGATK